MPTVRETLGSLIELAYPRTCPACERILGPQSRGCCPDCTQKLLKATSTEYCPRCGATVEPYLVDGGGCRLCRRIPYPVDGFARVGPYDSLVGELVRRYKYGRQQRMDRMLSSMLAAVVSGQAWCGGLDALVPVPASLAERLHYRFFPVGLLATAAARELYLPVLPIVRVRGKKRRQVGLPASARAQNVRGIFHLARHAQLEGARLCVVDDVATSNATLNEMATVLKRAGAARVDAAVLAKSSSFST